MNKDVDEGSVKGNKTTQNYRGRLANSEREASTFPQKQALAFLPTFLDKKNMHTIHRGEIKREKRDREKVEGTQREKVTVSEKKEKSTGESRALDE